MMIAKNLVMENGKKSPVTVEINIAANNISIGSRVKWIGLCWQENGEVIKIARTPIKVFYILAGKESRKSLECACDIILFFASYEVIASQNLFLSSKTEDFRKIKSGKQCSHPTDHDTLFSSQFQRTKYELMWDDVALSVENF